MLVEVLFLQPSPSSSARCRPTPSTCGTARSSSCRLLGLASFLQTESRRLIPQPVSKYVRSYAKVQFQSLLDVTRMVPTSCSFCSFFSFYVFIFLGEKEIRKELGKPERFLSFVCLQRGGVFNYIRWNRLDQIYLTRDPTIFFFKLFIENNC